MEAEQAKAYMAEAAQKAQERQARKDRKRKQADGLIDNLSYGVLR
jgi:hypothetical protein